MVREEITFAEFEQGYEEGTISDVIVYKGRLAGKQSNYPSNIPSSQRPPFRVVYAVIP
jgi:hypothetical protein